MSQPLSQFAIHQMVTGATPGNAIFNEALIMQASLQSWGVRSHIYAERIHPSLAGQIRPYQSYQPSASDRLIFHFSLGSDLSDFLLDCPTPQIVRYHNMTPAHFLAGTHAWLRTGVEKGMQALPRFAQKGAFGLADSSFNALDLEEAGFSQPGLGQAGLGQTAVLPLMQPDQLTTITPDPTFLHQFNGDYVNWLFVGRMVPHKKVEDIVTAFAAYRQLNPAARLLLAGVHDAESAYGHWLVRTIDALGVADGVQLLGHVSDAELAAVYTVANVYVCLSEHEGFCNPLVESMRFGVPVIAYAKTAVPETMGGAGILLHDKSPCLLAALVAELMADTAVRQQIIDGQTKRVRAFALPTLQARFKEKLETFLRPPAAS